MEAPDVKAFYDWLYETHRNSIKVHSVLHSYWRRLLMLYEMYTNQGFDRFAGKDVVNVRLLSLANLSSTLWFEANRSSTLIG